MNVSNRLFLVASVLAGLAVGLGVLSAQEERNDAAVAEISRVSEITDVKIRIQESAPPNLVVEAEGMVPTGGWTRVTLLPREYATPPADGIYEYDLLAVRPDGPAIQVLTTVKASHTWKGFPTKKVKGVRIYGIGKGSKTVMLGTK